MNTIGPFDSDEIAALEWLFQSGQIDELESDVVRTEASETTQSKIWGRRSVSSDMTTDGTSIYYLVDSDAAGGTVTLTLASADAQEGREVNIKRDGMNDVTIDTEGSETIEDQASILLNQDQETVTLVYNNADSDWEIW